MGAGLLLDTFLVRSLLIPALALQIGPGTWWPSKLPRPVPQPVRTRPVERVPARS